MIIISLVIGLIVGILFRSFLSNIHQRDTDVLIDALSKYIFCVVDMNDWSEDEELWREVEDAFFRVTA